VNRLRGEGRRAESARGKVRRDRAATGRVQRLRRGTTAAILGAAPIVVLAWTGCSDDPPTAAGGGTVDPGGTHGAEIQITIKGRGRVTSDIPGIDCPSSCFAKFVFPSASADGAAGGVTLKASPTPGLKFLGWSFDTEVVGSRGRGPAACNPVKRAATQPSVNVNDAEITLPFGEVDGTPPEGQEAACAGYTKVPVLYRVTASFETEPAQIDAGVDAGTTDAVVYEPPQVGADARQIGMAQDRLYWLYMANGFSGIAYGANPSSPSVPQTPVTVLSPASGQTVSIFEVDHAGVVYQTASGVFFVRTGTTTPVPMGSNPGTCRALAADTASNVYCRTDSEIVVWPSPSYAKYEVLFTNVPSGNDLAVDATAGTVHFSTVNAINELSLADADGSEASPTVIVSDRSNPSGLESGAYLWWVELGRLYASEKAPASTARQTGPINVTATSIAPDTESTYFWAANTTTIYRAHYLGGASTQTFKTGLSGVTGVAADSTYVYWTQNDGRVRRAPKN